jgi:hypothetical protein
MEVNLMTKQDLQEFKEELLSEMKRMIEGQPKIKKWLKSHEVKNILGCSDSTLQNLRMNGTLEFGRVGGTVYFPYEAVLKLLDGSLQNSNPNAQSN